MLRGTGSPFTRPASPAATKRSASAGRRAARHALARGRAARRQGRLAQIESRLPRLRRALGLVPRRSRAGRRSCPRARGRSPRGGPGGVSAHVGSPDGRSRLPRAPGARPAPSSGAAHQPGHPRRPRPRAGARLLRGARLDDRRRARRRRRLLPGRRNGRRPLGSRPSSPRTPASRTPAAGAGSRSPTTRARPRRSTRCWPRSRRAGGTILRPGAETFWGGYSGASSTPRARVGGRPQPALDARRRRQRQALARAATSA